MQIKVNMADLHQQHCTYWAGKRPAKRPGNNSIGVRRRAASPTHLTTKVCYSMRYGAYALVDPERICIIIIISSSSIY